MRDPQHAVPQRQRHDIVGPVLRDDAHGCSGPLAHDAPRNRCWRRQPELPVALELLAPMASHHHGTAPQATMAYCGISAVHGAVVADVCQRAHARVTDCSDCDADCAPCVPGPCRARCSLQLSPAWRYLHAGALPVETRRRGNAPVHGTAVADADGHRQARRPTSMEQYLQTPLVVRLHTSASSTRGACV
jgi:hypothetical protein